VDAFTLSQLLVAIAIVFDVISFQFKARERIVACLFMSGILISIHFCFLAQWTAAGLMGIATVRYLTSIFTTSKKAMWGFSGAAVLMSSLTFSGLVSVISCIGTLFQTRAAFCQRDKDLRLLMIVGTSFWLVHNILVGSPVAVLMEMLFIGSNLVGYYRHYFRGQLHSSKRKA
jgi:hypothetical protein